MTSWVRVNEAGVVDAVSFEQPMREVRTMVPEEGYVETEQDVYPGWMRQENGSFAAPPQPEVPEPPPAAISRRQFFQAAAVMSIITQEEALAALRTGELPPLLEGIVAQMPAEQQFALRMLLAGADSLHIDHPAVPGIAAALNMDAAQTLHFWRLAGSL